MNIKHVFKLIYLHITIIYTTLVFIDHWVLKIFDDRYIQISFPLVVFFLFIFKLHLFLSQIVQLDTENYSSFRIFKIIRFSEYLLLISMAVILFSNIIFFEVHILLVWFVTGAYLFYLILHPTYYFYRKSFL
ncbi:MAG: hypothetical protein EA391_05485 [Balneolaceae bacterium]|nr:MAG: hypothetical protein EA391_05485 [Balneolaceae bacterium]